MTPRKRYRCRSCGAELPAWLPVFQAPDGALLLAHLAQQHPDQVGAYLDRIPTDDDHDRVVVEAYKVVEERASPGQGAYPPSPSAGGDRRS